MYRQDTERRRYNRKNLFEDVSFQIHKDAALGSVATDISWSGLRLAQVDNLEGLSRDQIRRCQHMPVTVTFNNKDLTAWGTLVRINQDTNQAGIRISRTTDDDMWRNLCGEE